MKQKAFAIITLLIITTLTACTGELHPSADLTFLKVPFGTPETEAQPAPDSNNTITIASFNIQIFGKAKASKPEVMQVLAHTITQFDIVAIQEIRDKSGTAIEKLEAEVDALGTDYEYIIGPRLGRTQSKEQYAYMYRTDTITANPEGKAYTYHDPQDIFHREPFIVYFQTKDGNNSFDFILLSIHTAPDHATEEINALQEAVKDAQQKFPDEQDFIILGDLNADCNYFKENDMTSPLRSDEFTWLITNAMDTNLAKSSCTYDRIIITTPAKEDYAGQAGVYRFDTIHSLSYDQAKNVSDHYPVWAVFHTDKDTD